MCLDRFGNEDIISINNKACESSERTNDKS